MSQSILLPHLEEKSRNVRLAPRESASENVIERCK